MITFIIISIIVLSIMAKVLSNSYRYKYDITKEIKFGKIYHIFDLISLIVPFFLVLIIKLTLLQFIILVISFLFIYSFEMSFFYNIFTNRNYFYVGKTDITDIILRKVFKLYYIGDKEYNYLTSKQRQLINFKAYTIYFVRLLLAVIGCILIEYINYFKF